MSQLTTSSVRLKQINVDLVKAALKASEYSTKASLAEATGLSVATCGNILAELLESGEVVEIEPERSGGGRPARRFVYNAGYASIAVLYAATESGVHTLTHAVANMLGEVVEEGSAHLDAIDLDAIDRLVGSLVKKHGNIRAIGIGVPGVAHNGTIGICDLPQLAGVALGEYLEGRYQVEVIVDNDMNLTALGFYQSRGYACETTIAFVSFLRGHFPGAGVIVDGKLLRGSTHFAGEVSFLPFGISREEQSAQLQSEETFISLVAKTIISLIAVINPKTVALTGQMFEERLIEPLYAACRALIPAEHMPQLVLVKDTHKEYMNGLIFATLESFPYYIQLVRRRV